MTAVETVLVCAPWATLRVPGSVGARCRTCRRQVSVSPKGQLLCGATRLCVACAAARMGPKPPVVTLPGDEALASAAFGTRAPSAADVVALARVLDGSS